MTTFNEIAHPRTADGRFTLKGYAEAYGGTDAVLERPALVDHSRTDALIEAASSGDAEVAERILSHLSPQERTERLQQIAQAEQWATWLEEDPFENSYAADMLPESAQITSLVDAEDFRDFDGVNFAEYGTALADAWRAETRRLAQAALQG